MRKTLVALLALFSIWGFAQNSFPAANRIVAIQPHQATIPAEPQLFLPLIGQPGTLSPTATSPADTPQTATPPTANPPTGTPPPTTPPPPTPPPDTTGGWPMLAANPQRTSWTADEVRGGLALDWYRPIEPYIPYKVQPIAANGKLYIATARGLYTFSASNGDLVWTYPTEIPLGHSPTIATINGRSLLFVGGYDHRIHALDANSGEAVAGYTPYVADGGFETNPLVVNNTIYTGNRDGYFYALDAITGNLKWRFKTNGPILYSAAYKNNVLYFASNDAHAYALDAQTGSQLWQSQKLSGSGFHSYWPVIYTHQATGKDYVIFSGGENYRLDTQGSFTLTGDETSRLFGTVPVGEFIGPTSTSIAGDWASGTVVIDASAITQYFESLPHRRTVFVLDATTGQEFTFDSDNDQQPEYAPFAWSGVTHAGTRYPPVINGVDGVYYQGTPYYSGGWVSRGGPVGWKFGTQYISRVHTGNGTGSAIGHASDEPMAYSSGGRLIYWSLCCDREAGSYDVTIPANQAGRDWYFYGYNLASNSIAPGYQQMYDAGDSVAFNNPDGWQIFSGKNQSRNGVYGKHGTTQSPPIPYQGKVFLLKGNALLAFSPTGAGPRTPLPLATTVPVQTASTPPTKATLGQRLEAEVQKMIAAGPLRPGYHSAGFIDLYGNAGFTDQRTMGELVDYFQNPADTIYTLLLAYPHLSASTQQQVKSYLQTNYGPGATYDFTRIVHVGWGTGAAREAFDIPPEMTSLWGTPYTSPSDPATEPICGWCGYWRYYPPFSFYAAWQYAQIVGNGDPTAARTLFDRIKDQLESPLSDEVLTEKPYWLNLYIAGYKGYLELQQLAGYPQEQSVLATYQRLLGLRVNHFTKDTPYPPLVLGRENWEMSYHNSLAVARNFMFLTPELGDYLHQQIQSQVRDAVREYETVAPYWFVSKFDASVGEGTFQHLYDPPALFQAKAYILKEPYADLVKWLDVPAFYQGDLFYIQNLVAALNAPEPTVARRVNAPYLIDVPWAPALAWFGQVSPTTNYADVRTLYYDQQLEVILHIIDRRLWYDETPTPATLTAGDAVSLLLKLDGNHGEAPAANAYQFVKQLGDSPSSQAVSQGDGSGWGSTQTSFTATSTWRGNGPNVDVDDKGWSVSFIIPFASLGLSGPPPPGTIWGLGLALHDRDSAAADNIPDQLWPETMDPNRPQSWGQLHFGVPRYSPPAPVPSNTITIRHGLSGATVSDAHVGGHTICGDNVDHWSEWGEANYAGFEQFNIQNQWDISDYPCFSKYYITFPLTALPPGRSIVSATVNLNLFGNAGYEAGQAQPSAIQVLTVADDWDEQTISWNNAPLPVENISVTWVNPVDFFHPGIPYTWDVSRATDQAHRQGQPLRLVFYSTDGEYHSGKYFWSSDAEEAVRPTLRVAYTDGLR